jgi:hypothetical protein
VFEAESRLNTIYKLISTAKKNLLMLFMEVVAVFSENHVKAINILCRISAGLFLLLQLVCIFTTGL